MAFVEKSAPARESPGRSEGRISQDGSEAQPEGDPVGPRKLVVALVDRLPEVVTLAASERLPPARW